MFADRYYICYHNNIKTFILFFFTIASFVCSTIYVNGNANKLLLLLYSISYSLSDLTVANGERQSQDHVARK